jgi:glycosyltransferase 2 family protein
MTRSRIIRQCAIGTGGLAVGGLFLWLALREVDVAELGTMIRGIDVSVLLGAALIYWVALGLRTLRWHLLLRELAPVSLPGVAETLLVGYAVNNVLPARLGEVARAAYAKRRLRIGRARVFGSIVIERVLDLVAIMACLLIGLISMRLTDEVTRVPTFELIAINAGAVIGVIILALSMLRSGTFGRFRLPRTVEIVLADFCAGIATLNKNSLLLCTLLSAGVWLFEVVALSQVFTALGVHLSVTQALLLMGAASLSTLVPTAPGYLGTYQLVCVLAMNVFGFSAAAGIAAATATQIALFGSVTIAGLAIVIVRAVRRYALDGRAGLMGPVSP